MITNNITVAVHVASTSPHVFSGAWARRVRVTHRRTRAVSEPGVRGDDGKCGDERPPACLPACLPAYLLTCNSAVVLRSIRAMLLDTTTLCVSGLYCRHGSALSE